jgi:4-hydroxythreonine-4-phosphate dehydrogenase
MKPIAVSMGDPAGIGLEIAVKAWAKRSALDLPAFYLIADQAAVTRAGARAGISVDGLHIEPLSLVVEEQLGTPASENAHAVIAAIEHGVRAVRGGEASALCTLPIAKASLYGAGFAFPGHTEFLAHLTQDMAWPHARGPVMMLAGASLRVALVTIHTPLAAVSSALSIERIAQTGRVVGQALQRDFGIANPRLALAGLNPHAGESGTIGREEVEIINPAAALLRAEGWDVSDALPADTLFHEGARSSYDCVLALYHDQGLIPLKTLHFWDSANITLGLPIVRTSPDHGVGFDIAGQNKARIDSFVEALRAAKMMAARRAQVQ